jgi:lipopolysaccharide export system protein LptA
MTRRSRTALLRMPLPRNPLPRNPLPQWTLALRLPALLVAAAVLAGPPAAWADLADRFQPTTVEADRMQYDDATKVNVFTGNVMLSRGTIRIRSDRMVLRQDAEGFQFGTATGKPATFRQKREGVDEWMEGQAEELEYDGRRETVRLVGNATVRRTQGGRVMDEIEGGLIVYDTRAEQFAVEGSPAGATTGGRVRITIQPRQPAPAAGTAGAAGPAGATGASGAAGSGAPAGAR